MPVKSLCDSDIWPQVRHFLTSGRPIPSPMSGSDHFRTTHFPLHSSTLPDLSDNPHSYYLARCLIQPSPLCAYNIPQCNSEIVPMKGFFASKFMQIRSGHGPALWSPVDPGTQLFTSPTESSLGDQCTVQMTTFMDVSIMPLPGQLHAWSSRWARHADATFQRRNRSPCLTLHIQLVCRSEARSIIHTPAKLDELLHTVFARVFAPFRI